MIIPKQVVDRENIINCMSKSRFIIWYLFSNLKFKWLIISNNKQIMP